MIYSRHLLLILYLILASPMAKSECDCSDTKTWKEAATYNKYIFSGKFIEINSSKGTLKITKQYKGHIASNTKLVFIESDSECAQPLKYFETGKEYLFNILDLKYTGPNEIYFEPFVCRPPKATSEAKELIRWLQSKEYGNAKNKN